MVLALALHLDPVYVGAHHLARFLVVTFAVAFGARRIAKDIPPRDRKRTDSRVALVGAVPLSGQRFWLINFGSLSRLCTCTMNAMANSGVAKLTMGMDTKAVISRPPT